MEKDWVSIYSTDKLHIAEMIKGVLSDHNIEAVEFNKKDSSYLFGEIELYVRHSDVIKAKYLIDKADS